jgi:Patatin-like phospholipase
VIRTALLSITAAVALCLGCSSLPPRKTDAVGPLRVTGLTDAEPRGDTVSVLDWRPVQAVPQSVAESSSQRQFNVLVLSGGGSDGAYCAGALIGWTEAGTRPAFDVVTGVSTGALIATLAFLGPARDDDLRRFYTTIRDKDLFQKRFTLSALLSDSLADPTPLARTIEGMVDQSLLEAIAAEHRKGRRLYVGTTHLDARRFVVWDMGAIAERGRKEDLVLFRKVLLASVAVPGFLPPVPITVQVDGRSYEEMHVDGGATANLFFRSPQVSPAEANRLGKRPLAGSNLYILLAGTLYADPGLAKQKLLPLVTDAITTLVYAKCQVDLCQLFTLSQSTGMNYRLASIPAEIPGSPNVLEFDPVDMTRLFDVGRRRMLAGKLWRSTPPGAEADEEVSDRTGVRLSATAAVPGAKSVHVGEATQSADGTRLR